LFKKQKLVKHIDHLKINIVQNQNNLLLEIFQNNIYQQSNLNKYLNKILIFNLLQKILLKNILELEEKHPAYYQKSKNQKRKNLFQEQLIKEKFLQHNLENFMIEVIYL